MDFELELAAFVGGPPTALGERITAKNAEDRIFGFVLMNDWSGKFTSLTFIFSLFLTPYKNEGCYKFKVLECLFDRRVASVPITTARLRYHMLWNYRWIILIPARDIQKWEYIPLGPFTAKNLGTSISPWIVTIEALRPYIIDNFPQEPVPFPYLQHDDKFNFDIKLEVDLKSKCHELQYH